MMYKNYADYWPICNNIESRKVNFMLTLRCLHDSKAYQRLKNKHGKKIVKLP